VTRDDDHLSVDGLSIRFDPVGGRITDMILEPGVGEKPLRPLHRAPWVTEPEALPETVALVERHLAGDFFCAPFGGRPGLPIHGWTANGHWTRDTMETADDGALTARYRLRDPVQGATVTKELILRPGHPFLYQCHRFTGGEGHLPIAHHAMIRVPGGATLSFSEKRFGVTPEAPPETDPALGRSVLAYPQRFTALSEVATADGDVVDASTYPYTKAHEDLIVLAEAHAGIGWSAALARNDGFLFFAVKDARRLPETILWQSNGGRDYAPWLGRHTHVLGIEEAATACHVNGRFDSLDGPSDEGLATGLVLDAPTTGIRYGFGAAPAPRDWTMVSDIVPSTTDITLVDVGGDSITLPFHGAHFGL